MHYILNLSNYFFCTRCLVKSWVLSKEQFFQWNIPLRYLLNAKSLFMSWSLTGICLQWSKWFGPKFSCFRVLHRIKCRVNVNFLIIWYINWFNYVFFVITYRFRLRRVVESLFFRLFTFLLIFIDVSVVIADLVQNPTGKSEITDLQKVDLIITVWFVVELILRYVSSFFRKKKWNAPKVNSSKFVIFLEYENR